MAHRADLFTSANPIALALPAAPRDAYAGLHGQVTDQSGAALSGVTVNATPETSGKNRETTTGVKGTYLFAVLTPGTYTATFRVAGFRPLRISDVKLAADLNRTLDVTMSLLTIEAVDNNLEKAKASGWSARLRENGWRQGEAAGRQKGEAKMLLRQLRRLYGPLAPAIEERVRSAGADQLLEWGERLVTSESLDEVFGTGGA